MNVYFLKKGGEERLSFCTLLEELQQWKYFATVEQLVFYTHFFKSSVLSNVWGSPETSKLYLFCIYHMYLWVFSLILTGHRCSIEFARHSGWRLGRLVLSQLQLPDHLFSPYPGEGGEGDHNPGKGIDIA